jgi:hypothetical protein
MDADVTADVAAYVDDTWQPAWMTRGSLHGWWHVAPYMEDDDVAAYMDDDDVVA